MVISQRHRRRCVMSGALRRLERGENLSPRAPQLEFLDHLLIPSAFIFL
jgi:hypothetical protein